MAASAFFFGSLVIAEAGFSWFPHPGNPEWQFPSIREKIMALRETFSYFSGWKATKSHETDT
jgi:hypothetical protein